MAHTATPVVDLKNMAVEVVGTLVNVNTVLNMVLVNLQIVFRVNHIVMVAK